MTQDSASASDWRAVHAEALDILRRYIRIDTSNPPGNEAPAARFLGAILEAEGIDCDYVETHPNREFVMARLRGDGSRGGALLLGNHLDVVPAEAESWDVPPFEGVVRDGRIHGRGALDMKGCGVMQLMTVLLLRRLGVPLRRDVIFLAVPDEEAGQHPRHPLDHPPPPGTPRRHRVRAERGGRRHHRVRGPRGPHLHADHRREGRRLAAAARHRPRRPRQRPDDREPRRAPPRRAAAARRVGPRPHVHAGHDRARRAARRRRHPARPGGSRRPRGRAPLASRLARDVHAHAQRHDGRGGHQGERDPAARRGRARLPPPPRREHRGLDGGGARTHRRPARRGRAGGPRRLRHESVGLGQRSVPRHPRHHARRRRGRGRRAGPRHIRDGQPLPARVRHPRLRLHPVPAQPRGARRAARPQRVSSRSTIWRWARS